MTESSSASAPRLRPLMTVLGAAVLFTAGEAVFAFAMRWHHPPGYYLTCAALTLGLAAGIGALGSFLRLSFDWVLLAWVAVTGLVVHGVLAGLLLGLAAVPPVRAPLGPRAVRGWLLGSCAALGLLFALPRGEAVAMAGGLTDVLGAAPGEAVGLAVLFALLYQTVPRILARWPRRDLPGGGERLFALALAVLALLLAAKPYLSRPKGTYRLPRSGDLESVVAVDRAARPHVVLIVLDTLRADHLSAYGYGRETTPSLTRLLAERPNGVVFPQAYANGTWTVPSHATLLTGLLPNEHGVHFALDGSVRFRFGLAERATTLAERLQARGYKTLGAFANHWLRIIHGLDGGFDRYFRAHHADPLPYVGERLRTLLIPGVHPEAQKAGARADDVNHALLTMVTPWSKSVAPLFVFANYGDTHGPYVPMPGFRGRFAPKDWRETVGHVSINQSAERLELLAARYDEEILYLDHHLGLLFAELERLAILDDAWVFITSDHGEAFGEHGVTEHGTAVYDEIVRVPLIVFPPAGMNLSPVPGPVSLVDVAATIAALAGTTLDGPGRDLRTLDTTEADVAIEFYGDPGKARHHGALAAEPAVSYLRGNFKLIRRGEDVYELYDLAADPGETNNLAASRPELVEELRAGLPVFGPPTDLGGGSTVDTAERARIQQMLIDQGYAGDQD